jgi:oxygen-independent coproporphyrinogen-3 oxidase
MVSALSKELDDARTIHPTLLLDDNERPTVNTLYFGGGSPSVLTPQELQRIFEAIRRNFDLSSLTETTLEANPEDLSVENLQLWKSLGINRLSIGIQSLNNEELQWMNRAHSSEQSRAAVARAAAQGFKDVSIDLIYGSEKKSLTQWIDELAWAAQCGASHLSCYAMTIEEKTTFGHQLKAGKMLAPPDEHAEEQFNYLSKWAAENGWEHYEISNLCKPSHRAIHNSNYWQGHPYIGIGPSAHSFDGKSRKWNIAQNHLYMEKIMSGHMAFEAELLSPAERTNERLMTGLRLMDGVLLSDIENLWPGYSQSMQPTIQALKLKGLLLNDTERLVIPTSSRFLCDAITVELMVE